jgi:putative two-component system response regulator
LNTSRSPIDLTSAGVLVVDDVPENLAVLGELLRGAGYRVQVATHGAAALRLAAASPQPDLILLDVMMPGMDGHEVLRRLQAGAATCHIPVVFLTARGEPGDEEFGLLQGASDYLTKPIVPAVVLARVRTQLLAKHASDWLRDQNALLEAEVARRMAENERIQRVTIRALAHLAETRDPETGNHILRTQAYMELLARALAGHPRFAAELSETAIDQLVRSAPLHDIGKVGIPDHILLKPGKLDAAEWEIMKTHAQLGADAIEQAESDIDQPLAFLTVAKQVARSHHEHWDGSGYPDGLAGEAIPLSARLMAVADVFDSLVSPRVYKEAFSFELARQTITEGRGSQFDADVVDAFLAHFDRFVEVARQHHAQRARPPKPVP